MAEKTSVTATPEMRLALNTLSRSKGRGEADRARAILLTMEGWTAGRIAHAFSVREDTLRQWRSDFMNGGIAKALYIDHVEAMTHPLKFR